MTNDEFSDNALITSVEAEEVEVEVVRKAPASVMLDPAVPAVPMEGGNEFDPMRMVKRALKGRFILAAVVTVLGAAIGGWAGWTQGKVVYQSQGDIEIARSTKGPILKETDQNGFLSQYDQFMQQQILTLTSEELVESALRAPAWLETGRGNSPLVFEDFRYHVKADHPANTFTLRVTFESENPVVAKAGVNALITAYRDQYKNGLSNFETARLEHLEDIENAAKAKIAALQKQIKEVSNPDLEQRYRDADTQSKVAFDDLAKLRVAQRLVLASQEQEANSATTAPAPIILKDLSIADIAALDPEKMGKMYGELKEAQAVVEVYKGRYGPNNPAMVSAINVLESLTRQVEEYAQQYRHRELLKSQDPVIQKAVAAVKGMTKKELQEQIDSLKTLYEGAIKEVAELSVQRKNVAEIEGEITTARNGMEEARTRRDTLTVEQMLDGRLNVMSMGRVPLRPSGDTRKKYGGVGLVGGAALPLAILILLGLTSRRYRYVDEISHDLSQQEGTSLLGVLPALPGNLMDGERAADAAQCIHQIRVLLNRNRRQGRRVFLVTSSTAGEGKTSLTASLGYSFMASGARTLMIDCDLIGQSLTRGFEADGKKGLHEAMRAGSMKKCLQRIAPGLALLAVGGAKAVDACTVSPRTISAILNQARKHFDVVLIDSGPLLGSVEASVLAPMVDEVVLTTSRNQEPRLIARTLSHLRNLGANVAGFVFNRAASRDFAKSYEGSSLRSVSAGPIMPVAPDVKKSKLGPLVDAVLRFMPRAEAAV